MGEKFGQLNNWWFKGKPGKSAKLGKTGRKFKVSRTVKKAMCKRRRQREFDPCRYKDDKKCYYKGIVDP